MRAMILAAGRGERLRPITDTIPKPLVSVGGKTLMVRHIESLKKAGIDEIVVNSAWLSEKIVDFLGDGSAFGVSVTHSIEEGRGLETAGGIIKALPFFKGEPFLVVNGDTLIDADYREFVKEIPAPGEARLFLVENPAHHPEGDFALQGGRVIRGGDYTFSGCALYTPEVFAGMQVDRVPLRPIFDKLIEKGALYGNVLKGRWFDVGTVQRLTEADTYARAHMN